MMLNKKILLISVFLFFILSLGMVYASDNATGDSILEDSSTIDTLNNSFSDKTVIETNDINSYYKEKNELTCYLKDSNGNAIENRNVSILLDGKTYHKTTDSNGEVTLAINLKPDSYNAVINFVGDDGFNSSSANSIIKIKKAPLSIKTSNFNTYVNSDLFFKAKIYNTVTKNPVSGIKVLFKVYSLKTKKFTKFYRTTNQNGIATLNKNLKVGTYIVYTSVVTKKHVSYNYSKNKATVKIKPTAEVGCCSFYIQLDNKDAICGFRRDSTYSVNIYIKNMKWFGRNAVFQYKTIGGYSFHTIVTSDGWMIGTGGADSASINKAIQKLAGEMVSAGKINNAKLYTIKNYIARLGIGHFAIKTPGGKYAAVWLNGIKTGKLNPGQFISVPNSINCFRSGNYAKYSNDPVKAAVYIAATDSYGLNKREITVYHYKRITKNYKISSSVDAYASNDDGRYSGLSSKAYLKDNIYFKNKFISKDSLPYALNKKYLGSHSFGYIDKLVKPLTKISAPEVHNKFNKSSYFKVAVKNKATNKAISGISVKIKIAKNNFVKYYTIKTDGKGMIRIDTKKLGVGNYNVLIMPANNKYYISAKSKIEIKR